MAGPYRCVACRGMVSFASRRGLTIHSETVGHPFCKACRTYVRTLADFDWHLLRSHGRHARNTSHYCAICARDVPNSIAVHNHCGSNEHRHYSLCFGHGSKLADLSTGEEHDFDTASDPQRSGAVGLEKQPPSSVDCKGAYHKKALAVACITCGAGFSSQSGLDWHLLTATEAHQIRTNGDTESDGSTQENRERSSPSTVATKRSRIVWELVDISDTNHKDPVVSAALGAPETVAPSAPTGPWPPLASAPQSAHASGDGEITASKIPSVWEPQKVRALVRRMQSSSDPPLTATSQAQSPLPESEPAQAIDRHHCEECQKDFVSSKRLYRHKRSKVHKRKLAGQDGATPLPVPQAAVIPPAPAVASTGSHLRSPPATGEHHCALCQRDFVSAELRLLHDNTRAHLNMLAAQGNQPPPEVPQSVRAPPPPAVAPQSSRAPPPPATSEHHCALCQRDFASAELRLVHSFTRLHLNRLIARGNQAPQSVRAPPVPAADRNHCALCHRYFASAELRLLHDNTRAHLNMLAARGNQPPPEVPQSARAPPPPAVAPQPSRAPPPPSAEPRLLHNSTRPHLNRLAARGNQPPPEVPQSARAPPPQSVAPQSSRAPPLPATSELHNSTRPHLNRPAARGNQAPRAVTAPPTPGPAASTTAQDSAAQFRCRLCDEAFATADGLRLHQNFSKPHKTNTAIQALERLFTVHGMTYDRTQHYHSQFDAEMRARGFPSWKTSLPYVCMGLQEAQVEAFECLFGRKAWNNHEAWKQLCITAGIQPTPPDEQQQRSAILNAHLNIVDLIDARIRGNKATSFETKAAQEEYTKSTGRSIRIDRATGGLLRLLVNRG